MARSLVLDVARGVSRAHLAAPTGIDRVDAAYRRWALSLEDRAVFGLARMRRSAWLLDREGLRVLDASLTGAAAAPRLDLIGLASVGKAQAVRRAEALVARHAIGRAPYDRTGRMVASKAPRARYLNTSHSAMLAHGLEGLAAADLRLCGLIHDTLPLDRPDYFRAETVPLFKAKLRASLAHADALIANSAATAARIRHWAGVWSMAAPEILVAPLGVETAVAARGAPDAIPPVFVALGTIEPRKNHLLLLKVWYRLFDQLGPSRCPHLHIVGRRGWENAHIIEALDCSPAIGVAVHERGALEEAELQALMGRATALLTPSFDEGFGLPVAEALAMGVPVLASDIPAHREVGGDAADYLDPQDDAAWEAAVRDFIAQDSLRVAAARARAERYHPPTWTEHFSLVEPFLQARDAMAPAGGLA